jgi:hypothetical protein
LKQQVAQCFSCTTGKKSYNKTFCNKAKRGKGKNGKSYYIVTHYTKVKMLRGTNQIHFHDLELLTSILELSHNIFYLELSRILFQFRLVKI